MAWINHAHGASCTRNNNVRKCACVFVHICVYMCIHINVYSYMYIIYMYIYICIYILYIYTYTFFLFWWSFCDLYDGSCKGYLCSESLFTSSFLLLCWICFWRSSWSFCHRLQELRHFISEYCILCDTGATHYRRSDLMFCDYLRDKHLEVCWGDSSTSRPLGTGHLIFLAYLTSARSDAKSII